MWFISFLILFINNSWASKDLPQLITKQAVENIRYISYEGDLTLYKRRSGQLMMSTNFDSFEISNAQMNDNFIVNVGHEKKLIAYEIESEYFTTHNIRKKNSIYTFDTFSKKATFMGEGKFAQIQFKDRWLTYFDPYTKVIHIKSLILDTKKYEIQIGNNSNPYFIPQVLILNEEEVIYTDINDQHQQGLILFNMVTKIAKPIMPALKAGIRIDLCKMNENLFIGEFSQISSIKHSTIYQIPLGQINKIENQKEIYNSSTFDTGNLKCNLKNQKLYFISEFNSPNFGITQNILELNPNDKSKKHITDFRIVSQFIEMDGRIIIPYYGEYYVAIGPQSNKADFLKKDGRKLEDESNE